MKYCPNCGKELFDEAVMCPDCKASFVKKFRLTVFHREQALPLINPAIKSEIDGFAPVPVKKGDSIVYELDEGMHFVKLTGQGRKNQLDINLNCDLMIMAEWNAATGGIDYRISQGQIQGSLPVNFQENAPVGSPQADEATEIVPENASSENEQVNEALPEPENTVPLADNEAPVGEYYQPVENAFEAMENNENINQPEAEENSLQPQTAFCAMCGKPIPIGEKLCTDCISAQMHSVQNVASAKPKKERKPLSKKTKTLIISLSAIVLAVLLAFGGYRLDQYIVLKNIEDTETSVYNQLINANDLSFVDVDSDGNIIGFKYSSEEDTYDPDKDTAGYDSNYVITKYLYNSETGKLCDPGEDTSVDVDDLTENILLTDGYYYYDGETSQINLVNKETVKVNINKDKKIVSLEYNGYTFKKPDDKTKPITDDYLDYLSRNRDADDKKEELETRLRNSRFSNSGFNVPMDDALDTFFESYTVSVEADRNDENIYRIYVEGPCYGYSYLYYAAAASDGLGLYLDTENVKLTYEYSESDNEISVVDDDIDGHSLRYLYVIASLY